MALGIRAKLTIAMLFATLVPLGGFWGMSYSASKDRIQASIKQDLTELSGKSVQKLDDWLDSNRRALQTLAQVPGLTQMDIPTLKQMLTATAAPYPWIRATFLSDSTGQQLARSNAEPLTKVGDRDYFKQAVAGQFGQQVVIGRANGEPSLLLAQAVVINDAAAGGRAFFGIASSSIDLTQISKEVTGTPVGKTGYRFIMANDGKLLAHFNPAESAKGAKGGKTELTNFSTHPMWAARNDDQLSFQRFSFEGKEWLGTIERSKLGWYVATVQTVEEAEAPLREATEQAIVVLVAAVALVLLLSFIIGGAVAKPIIKLTQVTDQISKGNFDDKALDEIKSTDEIGQLSEAVKRLSSSVRIAMDALMKQQR